MPSNSLVPPKPFDDTIAFWLGDYGIDVSSHISLGNFIKLVAYISMMTGSRVANDPGVHKVKTTLDQRKFVGFSPVGKELTIHCVRDDHTRARHRVFRAHVVKHWLPGVDMNGGLFMR